MCIPCSMAPGQEWRSIGAIPPNVQELLLPYKEFKL